MRRKDREVTNIIEILQIIEKAKVLHLALAVNSEITTLMTSTVDAISSLILNSRPV